MEQTSCQSLRSSSSSRKSSSADVTRMLSGIIGSDVRIPAHSLQDFSSLKGGRDKKLDCKFLKEFKELEENENQLKKRIKLLEDQERNYIRLLKDVKVSNEGSKLTLEDTFEQKQVTREMMTVNKQLRNENLRLSNELQDLQHELNNCSRTIGGSGLVNIEYQKSSGDRLEEKLAKANRTTEMKELTCKQGVEMLVNKVKHAEERLSQLSASNNDLKKQLGLLDNLYNKMQKEFMLMKEHELEALKKLDKKFNPVVQEKQIVLASENNELEILLKNIVSEIVALAKLMKENTVANRLPSSRSVHKESKNENIVKTEEVPDSLVLLKSILFEKKGSTKLKFPKSVEEGPLEIRDMLQVLCNGIGPQLCQIDRKPTDQLHCAILCLAAKTLRSRD